MSIKIEKTKNNNELKLEAPLPEYFDEVLHQLESEKL